LGVVGRNGGRGKGKGWFRGEERGAKGENAGLKMRSH